MDAREFHKANMDWNGVLQSMLKQGPGWVLLGYIVWWGTTKAQAKIGDLETIAQAQVTTSVKFADLMQQHVQGTFKYQRAMLELQAETCLSQANTSASAKKCREILYDAEFGR